MFLLILGIAVIIAAVIIWFMEIDEDFMALKKKIAVGVAVFAVLLMAMSCYNSVPTGHTGVVTVFGRVENYTLDAGIHMMAPWKKVIKMDNRVRKETVELSAFSSDIQEVSMVYTVNFQINKANAMTIYSTIGKDYYTKTIQPAIMESVKVVAARYTAESLVGNRNELAAAIEDDVSEKLRAYNIELVSTSIEDMDFTDAFTQAVEAKQVAAQNKLKAETEAAQRVVEANAAAEVRKVQAEAEAYETTTKAKAEADALLVMAEAEAQANKEIAESLTDALISYTYANGWDGKLPTYMTSEGGVPVFKVGQ